MADSRLDHTKQWLFNVRWDNGGEKIACTNWRECRYRENVVPTPADEQS